MEAWKEAEEVQLGLLLALDKCGKRPHITLLVDAGSVNGRKWSAQTLLSMRERGLVSFMAIVGPQTAAVVGQEQIILDSGETWIKPSPVGLTESGRALAREVVGELADYRPIESTRTRTKSQGPMDDWDL